jgi:hypothetical protein
MSWRGVATEVGLLSVVAKHRFPGCLAANMRHATWGAFLGGLSNSQVGSAIEHPIFVFAGWVAWRRVCNVQKVDVNARGKSRATVLNSCA